MSNQTPMPTIESALSAEPARTIPEVIARMRAIRDVLPESNGLAAFNRLYLAVTEAVEAAMAAARFSSPAFLARLDVLFANLYFRAVAAWTANPTSAPRAWVPLLENSARRDIAPLQFAFAGMNAHINRDLPVALVQAWTELGLGPRHGGSEHEDFLLVNALLVETQERVRASFSTGLFGFLDRLFGRSGQVVAAWNVERAREAAWTNGEALWTLRDVPDLHDAFLRSLDAMVGFAGRGLLVPVEPKWKMLLRQAADWTRGLLPWRGGA